MTPEVTSRHLDDIDILIVKYRLLGQNDYIQTAFQHTIDAAQYLTSIYEEKRDKDQPVIQPPTQETLVDFADGVLKDIENIVSNLKRDAGFKDMKPEYKITPETIAATLQESVIYTMAWTKLKQAEMFVKAFFEESKAEKKEFDEYNNRIKEATDIVILVNEEAKGKYAEPAIKSIWPTIYEKDHVYFHNELEPYISGFMKAPNVKYDSLHCDECLKKFDLNKTVFFLIGFKNGEKLPVDLPKDAYCVSI